MAIVGWVNKLAIFTITTIKLIKYIKNKINCRFEQRRQLRELFPPREKTDCDYFGILLFVALTGPFIIGFLFLFFTGQLYFGN